MHTVLNQLLHQLWLTVVVAPLGPDLPTCSHFDPDALKCALGIFQDGLYIQLEQQYFHLAGHFERAEEAGTLAGEANSWKGWMGTLRQHIHKMMQVTSPGNGTSQKVWHTTDAVNFLVSFPSPLSVLSAFLTSAPSVILNQTFLVFRQTRLRPCSSRVSHHPSTSTGLQAQCSRSETSQESLPASQGRSTGLKPTCGRNAILEHVPFAVPPSVFLSALRSFVSMLFFFSFVFVVFPLSLPLSFPFSLFFWTLLSGQECTEVSTVYNTCGARLTQGARLLG